MIGLVRLLPPPGGTEGIAVLDSLPAPPASRFAGVIVRCDDATELKEALDWCARVRDERPSFTFGLVCSPELCAGPLGSFTHSVVPVLAPGELLAGGIPKKALADARSASIEGRILEELVLRRGPDLLTDRPLIQCLIAHAVRGGTLETAARDLRRSPDTIRRRLRRYGILPGGFMSAVRLLAYDLRVSFGESPAAALAAGGWNSQKARLAARSRLAAGKAPEST